MVLKPKTIKDLQANTKVLNALNKNHRDDIFSSNKPKKKEVIKVRYTFCSPIIISINQSYDFLGFTNTFCTLSVQVVKQGPKDILDDLFDSDSENDISLHSARTPIGRFFERTDSRTPANNEEIQSDDDIYRSQTKNE